MPFARRRAGWPSGKSASVEFPEFAVLGATHDKGRWPSTCATILTSGRRTWFSLLPLDAAEKPKYGLAGVSTRAGLSLRQPEIRGVARGRADPPAADGPHVFVPSRRAGRVGLPLRIDLHGRRSPDADSSRFCCRRARRRRCRLRRSTARRSRSRVLRSSASSGVGQCRWPSRAIGFAWPSISNSHSWT